MSSFDEQMREAIHAQREHVKASRLIDRTGWTREQWVADAERQFDDLHGSILDLTNGHVGAMLVEIGLLRARLDKVRKLRSEWAKAHPKTPNHELWAALGQILDEKEGPA